MAEYKDLPGSELTELPHERTDQDLDLSEHHAIVENSSLFPNQMSRDFRVLPPPKQSPREADSSLRDELMQCFREWTDRQAAALNLLSAQLQAQSDAACNKILTVLEKRDTNPLVVSDVPSPFSKTLAMQQPPQRPDLSRPSSDGEPLAKFGNSEPASPPPTSPSLRDKASPERQVAVSAAKWTECAPVVQFSSPMYFCMEDEKSMVIEVMRIGNLKNRTEVKFTTVDATAKAGEKYQFTEGILRFEPGDDTREIKIPLINTDRWETTVEFKVQLLEEGIINATRGLYLDHARVKIIDTDTFPTNKYDKEIQQLVETGDKDTVPKQSLLVEYWRLSWNNSQCRGSTIRMVLADQLHNVNFLLGLFLNVYLVDYVLSHEKPDSQLIISGGKTNNLILIVALTLIPFAFSHVLDFVRDTWKLNAGELQRNLLRKFLNYDESARVQLAESTLILGMTRDSGNLVEGGYLSLIKIVQHSGKLIMILVYQLTSPFVFGTTDSFEDATFWVFSLGPLITLPMFLIVFISCRRKRASHIIADRNSKEDRLIDCAFETSRDFRLIADYARRPDTVAKFSGFITEYMDACTDADQVITNNVYFQKWLTMLLLAMITIGLGTAVIDSDYPVGMFLANTSVCASVGDCYAEIYDSLLSMEKILPQLMQVTWLMNLPTDLAHRMKLNRARRQHTKEEREEHRLASLTHPGEEDDSVVPVDRVNITLKNVHFVYNSKGRVRTFDFQGLMDIKQGHLVALVGHKGHGKTTVLKILGGVVLPRVDQEVHDKGQIFYVPSHLRVLHVSTDPIFFDGTLHANLTYGCPSKQHHDATVDRVEKICKMLGLPPEVTDYLRSDDEVDWNEVFSMTQQSLLSLGRAFVANPEIMCIHKPTMTLDPKTSTIVINLLRAFVDQRGIEQPSDTLCLRRPRTCIVTVSRHETLRLADEIYLVEPSSVKRIPWQSVSPDILQ